MVFKNKTEFAKHLRKTVKDVCKMDRYNSREQFLEKRRNGIGGSDASIVIGTSDYAENSIDVYLSKIDTSYQTDIPANYVKWGEIIEIELIKQFNEKYGIEKGDAYRLNYTFTNKTHKWQIANVDGIGISPDGKPFIVECKNLPSRNYDRLNKTDEGVPYCYYTQMQHYLSVIPADKCYFYALIDGKNEIMIEVEKDEAFIEKMTTIEEKYWDDYVLRKTRPNEQLSDKQLKHLFPRANKNKEVELSDKIGMEIFEEYLKLLKQEKTFNEEKRKIQKELKRYDSKIKEIMGDAEAGAIGGVVAIKWSERANFSTKKLKEEQPEIYNEYQEIVRRYTRNIDILEQAIIESKKQHDKAPAPTSDTGVNNSKEDYNTGGYTGDYEDVPDISALEGIEIEL